MIALDRFKELAHKRGRSQRDLALAALACRSVEPKQLGELEELYAAAGVTRTESRQLRNTLRKATGLARKVPAGFELTSEGLSRTLIFAGADTQLPLTEALQVHEARKKPRIFIGHGGSPIWTRLERFLEKKLHCDTEEFNRISPAGKSNKERLKEMLDSSNFAFLILTAEDEASDGSYRARQNVVHEAGLFQARLGFERAIVLLEDGCADFSNIDGLAHIPSERDGSRMPLKKFGACSNARRSFAGSRLRDALPYILSTNGIPSTVSPSASTRPVRSHSFSRESRTAASPCSTGQLSKNALNAVARS